MYKRAIQLFSAVVLLAGCAADRVHLTRFFSEETVHSAVLAHTPVGSSGTNVLQFVVKNFPHKRIDAYYQYVDSLEDAENRHLPVGKTDWMYPPRNTIDVYLGSYPVGLFFAKEIEIKWLFNEQDILTNIVVRTREYGP